MLNICLKSKKKSKKNKFNFMGRIRAVIASERFERMDILNSQSVNILFHQTEELFQKILKSKCNFVCKIHQKYDVTALIIHYFKNTFYFL